jgi:hypothetical protein
MSIYLYDKALIDKIKSWTQHTDVHVYGPDDTRKVFEVIADSTNDKPIELPIIVIRRKSSFDIKVPRRQVLSYDGPTLDASFAKSLQLNAIPVTIDYQIDIYCRYLQEADEYVRNLIFNLINFPSLTIKIPYNDLYKEHNCSMIISPTINDNSDIPERLVSGQFTRFTIDVTLADAYLWDVRYRDNYQIEAQLDVEN